MICRGQSECSVPDDLTCPLHLLQHRFALLQVQRRGCTHSSRCGCTEVFYNILLSNTLTMLHFLGCLAASAHTKPPEGSRQRSQDLFCIARAGSEHHVKFTKNLSIILYQPLLPFIRLLFMFHVPQFLGSTARLATASLMLSPSHVGGMFGPQVYV